jgi:serine/threonine-protein kinase ATR
MRSLAKPRKLVIKGTDGQTYTFLGKPRDDLRKDARIMDLNSIINRLLKARSEYRRRRLCEPFIGSWPVINQPHRYADVRTYSVVTLNEECGLVQWVPNTLPVRNVLTRYYDGKGIRSWVCALTTAYVHHAHEYAGREHLGYL